VVHGRPDRLSRCDLADPGGSVSAPGEEPSPVGAEGDRINRAPVRRKVRGPFFQDGVPDPEGAVEAPGGDPFAIGAEGDGKDLALMRRGSPSSRPVAASQSRAVPSPLPVTSHRPSGLKAAARTGPRCSSGGPIGPPRGRLPEPGGAVIAPGKER